jgi:predicted dehydrogenase
VRFLLIGYGSIGRRHAEVLRAARPGADIHLVTRQAVAGFPVHPSLDAVPDPASYDYYVIASETGLHLGQLEWLLGRVRGKTLLVEKPVFDRPAPVEPGGNRVLVAYNLRFHAVLQALRDELAGARILYAQAAVGQYLPTWRPGTDYRLGYSARKGGGGVLLDLSHEVDYVQWLFGRIESAAGFSGKVSDLEIDSDDLAAAVCRTRAGTVVSLSLDYLSRIPFRRVTVQAADRTAVADLVAGTLEVSDGSGPAVRREFPGLDRNHSYRALHEAALGDGAGCCTLAEGLDVLSAIDMIRAAGGATA